MRHPLVRFAPLGVAALVAVACSDATTGTSGDRLTSAEAQSLASALSARSTASVSGGTLPNSSTSNATASATGAAPFSLAVSLDVPCPRGGSAKTSVTIAGTEDRTTHSLTADLNGTFAPNGCAIQAENGVTFTLSGTGLTSGAHVAFANGQPTGEHTASLEGSFSWTASDGRSGTCAVDYDASANYTTKQAKVNGDFCGNTVAYSGALN